jgi:hypothetical protein
VLTYPELAFCWQAVGKLRKAARHFDSYSPSVPPAFGN